MAMLMLLVVMAVVTVAGVVGTVRAWAGEAPTQVPTRPDYDTRQPVLTRQDDDLRVPVA